MNDGRHGVLAFAERSFGLADELKRPFRTPWVPLVPILGMGFCAFLMAGLPAITWEAFFIWSAIGLAIYFVYSRTHSELAPQSGT